LLPIGLVCEILFAPQGRTHLHRAGACPSRGPFWRGECCRPRSALDGFRRQPQYSTLTDPDQRAWLDRTETFLLTSRPLNIVP
jgi:hypothetical protein